MAESRICSIPDCGKTVRSRGWCRTHYDRWLLNGHPLKGLAFKGEPQAFLNQAILFAGEECLLWPYARTKNGGYGRIRLDGKDKIVSRVVCEAVHGQPPTNAHEAAHSCGRGGDGCVNPSHLRWATPKENQSDRKLHETDTSGERNGASKLTAADVSEMRAIFNDEPKMTLGEMAFLFGVSKSTAGKIRNYQMWKPQSQ